MANKGIIAASAALGAVVIIGAIVYFWRLEPSVGSFLSRLMEATRTTARLRSRP